MTNHEKIQFLRLFIFGEIVIVLFIMSSSSTVEKSREKKMLPFDDSKRPQSRYQFSSCFSAVSLFFFCGHQFFFWCSEQRIKKCGPNKNHPYSIFISFICKWTQTAIESIIMGNHFRLLDFRFKQQQQQPKISMLFKVDKRKTKKREKKKWITTAIKCGVQK